MGIVYRARDLTLSHDVILKIINFDMPETPHLKHFQQEFEILRSLRHPHIVGVYDFSAIWSLDGHLVPPQYYLFSMDLVEGDELMTGLKTLTNEKELFRIIGELLRVLYYIHFCGILHNDINSRNIYLTSEERSVKLLDFSLSEFLDRNDPLSRMKRAGDFEDLFHLLEEIPQNCFPALEPFLSEVHRSVDFTTGDNIERLFDIFNAHTPGSSIMPAHTAIDHYYTVSTMGLQRVIKPVKGFLATQQEKNRVLFLTGDIYSEVIPVFYESLEILQLDSPFLIRFKANTIMDTLNSLIKSLQHIDVEGKYLDAESPEIKKILDWDDSVLAGDNKYIVYNRLLTVIQSLSDKYKLTFSVTYITSKREEIVSFLLYLINGLQGNSLTWVFFDLSYPLDLRKKIQHENNAVASFTFETLPKDIFIESVNRIYLIPESEYPRYTSFYDTLYKKTKGKCALLANLTRSAAEEGLISFEDGSYHFSPEALLNYPFSFSYDNLWHQRVNRLSEEEKTILSTLAFYEKFLPWDDARALFSGIPELEKKLHRLVKENFLTVTGGKSPLFSVRGQLFINFLSEDFPPPPAFARRAVAVLLQNPDSFVSLESHFFLLTKMQFVKDGIPHLVVLSSIHFLQKYSRETHRPEIQSAVTLLEDTLPLLPQEELYYRGWEALGLFYYYSNQDDKALNIFESIDCSKLRGENLLTYYLNFSKLLFFIDDFDRSLQLCRQGALLAKKEQNRPFRYYFLNVKGLILTGLMKDRHALRVYDAVFSFLLIHGITSELSNFISNYFNLLLIQKKHTLLMQRGKELLKRVHGNLYQVTKAKLHILIQMSQSLISEADYSKALEYLDKAYVLAESTQSFEEMISILNNRVIAKYFISFDNEKAIEDLKETIAVAKKHQVPILANTAFYNLTEAYQDSGQYKEALETFRDYARSVIGLNKKKNLSEYLSFLSIGTHLYIRMGQRRLAYHCLSLLKRHMMRSPARQNEHWERLYLLDKSFYYFYTGCTEKEILCLKEYLDSALGGSEPESHPSLPQEIIEAMLRLLYAYHRSGDDEHKMHVWEILLRDYSEFIGKDNEFNWAFYKGLVCDDKKKALSLFEKGLVSAIRQKDIRHIDHIARELMKHAELHSVKYYNTSLLLYLSVKMVYTNLPRSLRSPWTALPYIDGIIQELRDAFSFLPSGKSLFSQSYTSVIKKIQSLLYQDFTQDNLRKARSLNRALMNSGLKESLTKIMHFLKKYFLAERIMIVLNTPYQNSFGTIKSVNPRLYSVHEPWDETLVQSAYMKGDFEIRQSHRFGTPLTSLVIPLINPTKKTVSYRREKRVKSISFSDIYLGYLYVDTKYPLSNITPKTVETIKAYTELIQLIIHYNELHEDIILDKTTYLLTRHAFLKELKMRLKHQRSLDSQCAFLMIDIDLFKKVNDRHGHQKGDEVLFKISSLLKKGIRRNDLIGRYGGEEFIAVLFNITREEAERKSDELRRSIEKAKIIHNMPLSVSIGCSLYPNDSEWINILINQADSALIEAKNRGRNRVVFWNKDLRAKTQKKDSLYGIITDDFSRSENMIRNLIEFFDVPHKKAGALFEEMVKRLIVAIPHTHYAYSFHPSSGNNIDLIQTNCLFDPEEIRSLDSGYHILANWRYLKEKTGPIHYDLIFVFQESFGSGFLIFSSPTTETEYNDGHYNLIDKFYQIFKSKLQS